MTEKVKSIKNAIENKTYDWAGAIMDTAEKIVVEAEANDIWKQHKLGMYIPTMTKCEYLTEIKNQYETDGAAGLISMDEAERGVAYITAILNMLPVDILGEEAPKDAVKLLRL